MKTAPSIAQHRGAGADFQRSQDFAGNAVRPLLGVDILHGNMLSYDTDASGRRTDGVAFTAGTPKKVPHRLGRKPNGWFVVRDFGTNRNQLLESATNTDDAFLYLSSAVDCTVYIWAF